MTEPELEVVYEDADVLVVDKPAYLLVHPVTPGPTDTLADRVVRYCAARGVPARAHPVSRLDRDTSGLVLFARSPEVHRRLAGQLAARTLRRGYLALVDGEVADEEGVVDAPIGRDPAEPPLRAVRPDGAPARTRFRVVERFTGATLLRLELDTGRTHQIRVHLAHLGHPVLGDRWYGLRGVERIGRQALHAASLAFLHPTSGAETRLEVPLPADMAGLREELRAATAWPR